MDLFYFAMAILALAFAIVLYPTLRNHSHKHEK